MSLASIAVLLLLTSFWFVQFNDFAHTHQPPISTAPADLGDYASGDLHILIPEIVECQVQIAVVFSSRK